jgi:ABC-2 type transport system ATP-binding protein
VLWATHLVDEAEAADRIVVMAAGKVRFDGSPQELIKTGKHANLTDAFLAMTRAAGEKS